MEDMPLPLKEIVDKGFPEPRLLDVIKPGSYKFINQAGEVLQEGPASAARRAGATQKTGVGFYFDGSFLPVRHGASYNLNGLMRGLAESGRVDSSLVNCFRGWDDPMLYANQPFRSILIHPQDFYHSTGVIESVISQFDLQIAQFINSEVLLNMAPRVKRPGAKVIFDVQNIEHVLLERLGAPQPDIKRAKSSQSAALEAADHTFCRSEIDRRYAIGMGARPKDVTVYRGGIHVRDFTFRLRLRNRKRLVYLGHMYYQPNENALDHIVNDVLPELENGYQLTVLGNCPPYVVEKYSGPQVKFRQGVENLSDELLRHDIALVPLLEGSGTRLKILDYLASGIPVISTRIGTEGLDPRIAEYVTIDDNLSNYASRVRDISANLAAYAGRAAAGRSFVEDEYEWSQCISPFIDVYQRLNEE